MSVPSVALSSVYEDYWNIPSRVSGRHGPWSNDYILIYLIVGGSVIPMHVLESDSIASVKLRIQKCKGFFAKKQKLIYDGKELARNDSRVCDYGVSDGNVLHLVLRLSDLQAITVRTVCGKEFEFLVQRKRNVEYVKKQIAKTGIGFFDLKDQELFCDGEELEDQRIIDDLCKSKDAAIHFLVRKSAKLKAVPVEKDFEVSIVLCDAVDKQKVQIVEPINIYHKIGLSPVIKKMIGDTSLGLEMGNSPIRSSEGSGGTYFMQDSSGQNYVSVFKPIDEEPMAVNNPRGLPLSLNGEGLKKGTRVGEGAIREVAAYVLDHPTGGAGSGFSDEKGFSGVLPTVLVKCQHEGFYYSKGFDGKCDGKFGSLQMFVKNSGSCEDVGPCGFPISEVHKICLLDIRLANTDRHAGNILICKDGDDGGIVLVPIDHGYCMPENFEDCMFEWLYWPQAREPFTNDEISYINSLDAESDIKILEYYGWNLPNDCARVFRVSTMLLKKGAKRGLTPFAIGSIMCRETVNEESVIEKMVKEAEEAVLPGTSESAFLESISKVMDRHLDGLFSTCKI